MSHAHQTSQYVEDGDDVQLWMCDNGGVSSCALRVLKNKADAHSAIGRV